MKMHRVTSRRAGPVTPVLHQLATRFGQDDQGLANHRHFVRYQTRFKRDRILQRFNEPLLLSGQTFVFVHARACAITDGNNIDFDKIKSHDG
jgi:hypothetical protein